MMKKMISFVMTFVMATTLMVAVAPAAEADAAAPSTTTVTYTSGVATPNYTVTVPSGIAFSDSVKNNVNADVILAPVNNASLGSLEVSIGVTSTNGYLMKNTNASVTDTLGYKVVYTDNSGGSASSVTAEAASHNATTPIAIGKVTASSMTLAGLAELTNPSYTPSAQSGYTDILTYTITETVSIQGN